MLNDAKAYIDGGAAFCAAGTDLDSIWATMAAGEQRVSAMPCPVFDGWPWQRVFMVDEPPLAALNFDRKVLRTMEKQAKLALYGAMLALRDPTHLEQHEHSRIGLYLGLPTVDEPVPPWPLLQAMHDSGEQGFKSEMLHREIPVFFGLSTLNSNACAHIAGKFGLSGAMAAHSPFADAGLQAVIDALLSIRSRENDAALVGGVAPKVNPLLILQYEHFGWTADAWRVPGEGSAFVVLGACGGAQRSVSLSGFARGFIDAPEQRAEVQGQVLHAALARAGICGGDVDWFLPSELNPTEQVVLQQLAGGREVPWANSMHVCGAMGPAGPVLNLLLADKAIRRGKYLHFDPATSTHLERPGAVKHVLVTACGPEGQYTAIILSGESS